MPEERRLGTVLVFKPGTSREDAERALRLISQWLDPDYFCEEHPPRSGRFRNVPFKVQTFNPDHGGPVWYIP